MNIEKCNPNKKQNIDVFDDKIADLFFSSSHTILFRCNKNMLH